MVLVAIAGSAMKQRPGKRETWVGIGVTAVYAMVVVSMGVGPAERTHILEYGLLAVLLHQAMMERTQNGRRVPMPAILTVVVTALLGWLDEGIQALLPNRVYDVRDIVRNALAGLLAVSASVSLAWARGRDFFTRRSVP